MRGCSPMAFAYAANTRAGGFKPRHNARVSHGTDSSSEATVTPSGRKTPFGIHDNPSREATTNRADCSPGRWNTAHAHSVIAPPHKVAITGSFSAATNTIAVSNSGDDRNPSPIAFASAAALAARAAFPNPITFGGGGAAGGGGALAGGGGGAPGTAAPADPAALGTPAAGGGAIGTAPAGAPAAADGPADPPPADADDTGPWTGADDDTAEDPAATGGGPAGIVAPGGGLNGCCAPADDAPEANDDGDDDASPCPTPFKNC